MMPHTALILEENSYSCQKPPDTRSALPIACMEEFIILGKVVW